MNIDLYLPRLSLSSPGHLSIDSIRHLVVQRCPSNQGPCEVEFKVRHEKLEALGLFEVRDLTFKFNNFSSKEYLPNLRDIFRIEAQNGKDEWPTHVPIVEGIHNITFLQELEVVNGLGKPLTILRIRLSVYL